MKTPAAQREVVLAPALVTLLREHWLAAPHKAPGDLVFTNALGRGLDYRDVGEGFRAAVKAAGLTGPGRLSLHSLRHTFASFLIAKGLDVVFVSRQLGHASPTTTLGSTRTSSTRCSTRRRRARRWRRATRRWSAHYLVRRGYTTEQVLKQYDHLTPEDVQAWCRYG